MNKKELEKEYEKLEPRLDEMIIDLSEDFFKSFENIQKKYAEDLNKAHRSYAFMSALLFTACIGTIDHFPDHEEDLLANLQGLLTAHFKSHLKTKKDKK